VPCAAIQRLLGKSKLKFIKKRKNGLGIIIFFILVVIILSLIFSIIIPQIISSIGLFLDNLPKNYERTLGWLDDINDMNIIGVDISIDGIITMLQERLSELMTVENFSSSLNMLAGISSVLFGVGSAIVNGVLALIAAVFFLLERDALREFFDRLFKAFVPGKAYIKTKKYSSKLNNNFKQYIRVQTIDGLILGTIATIELFIMRSPYALLLGIMLGIINYIPYFGSIIGSIIAVAVIGFTQGIAMAGIAAVVLLITQQIDGNIIQPKLMSGSFKVSPLLVIIGVIVGGAAASVIGISRIIGMLAAIPIIAVLKDILFEMIENSEKKEKSKLKKAEESEEFDESEESEETDEVVDE